MHDLNDHTKHILGDKIARLSVSVHQQCRESLLKLSLDGGLFCCNSSLGQTDCFSGLNCIVDLKEKNINSWQIYSL